MTSRRIFISSFALLGIVTAAAIAMMAGPRFSRHDEGAPAAVDAAPVAAAQEVTVGQRNKQFGQDHMTLKAGDRIKFVNDDTVAHNIFVTGPGDKTRNSGVQEPGESAVLSFDAPGTYGVECGIHPEMRMTVEVK
jgi:cytochrome c peroxidase